LLRSLTVLDPERIVYLTVYTDHLLNLWMAITEVLVRYAIWYHNSSFIPKKTPQWFWYLPCSTKLISESNHKTSFSNHLSKCSMRILKTWHSSAFLSSNPLCCSISNVWLIAAALLPPPSIFPPPRLLSWNQSFTT